MAREMWKHTGPKEVFPALLDCYCQTVAFAFRYVWEWQYDTIYIEKISRRHGSRTIETHLTPGRSLFHHHIHAQTRRNCLFPRPYSNSAAPGSHKAVIFVFGHSANGDIFEPCIPRNWDSRTGECSFVHPYFSTVCSHFAIGISPNIIINYDPAF